MRVLLWHGYLLRGSGSNIYTANIARAWRSAGHDVLLMCQEHDVSGLDFIDAHGDFVNENTEISLGPTGAPPAPGSCHLVRPDIQSLLPVYVYDEYAGFTVKRFVDLTDDELAVYTDSNIRALRTALAKHRPDAVITGHEVMGPYIARLACSESGDGYLAKLHGSALEWAVKLQERYLRFASEGLGAAKVVAGGSNYMIEEASRIVPGWRERAQVVNPGCDIDLFKPTEVPRARDKPVVAFVGKLMAAKGVHHLLAAIGLVATDADFVIVGYGGFEAGLQELASALQGGDFERALEIAAAGEGVPLEQLSVFLTGVRDDESYRERVRQASITFTGRLDHEPLAKELPHFDLLVVPSVVPEAFGMVAAEAAACAVLPLVPAHSGIGEVGATLEAEFQRANLPRPALLTFDPDDPIRGIAAGIDRVLAVPSDERRELGLIAARLAAERWSWSHVADRLLELATQ